MRYFPCTTKNDICLRRNAPHSIGLIYVFVYPLFVVVIERAEGHFCPHVSNDNYLNVSALLSKLLSKNGNEGASDLVCMVRSLGICFDSKQLKSNTSSLPALCSRDM